MLKNLCRWAYVLQTTQSPPEESAVHLHGTTTFDYSTMKLLLTTLLIAVGCVVQASEINFDKDVRPILSDKCFQCHGPDEARREADLRLDTSAGALADLGGYAAFVASNPAESEAIRRINSEDDNELMPPPESKLRLSAQEKQTLRRWVEQGAKWSAHWSFMAPRKPRIPDDTTGWSINAIDHFVKVKASEAGLTLGAEAAKETVLRRVTLDLTGLPPTLEEIDEFMGDSSPNAYERVVDRLLASPYYGERMAWEWLDAARYADTDGFQGDPTRTMWPWRDWLVDALNQNMPFDQFTVEMLAGDLLKNATAEQILATGFNRNHTFNGEGGRIPEETRVENVFDRTETTSTVWLGLTMTCCRCHDHKYDPITQQEYFQLYDFFNQTSETGKSGRGKTEPVLDYLTPEKRQVRDSLRAQLDALETAAAAADLESVEPQVGRDQETNTESQRSETGESPTSTPEDLQKQLDALNESAVTVMVMDDNSANQRRPTQVLVRGSYDQPSMEVSAGTPACLPPLPTGVRPDRLALAEWLVNRENPLTARVTVNRYWQMFFGKGLVLSTEDFGSQGSRPSHPELLDWLAVQFMDSGWNVKDLHKLIVMSATYRQSSEISPHAYATDPENEWLAHAPRFRMPAWMLRDQALAIGGLLVTAQGGPPVKPYQPEGIWSEATFGKIRYEPDVGDKLYRRSLYTFWRRIVGPTMFFDGSKRQTCEVKPTRTNTPLHALTTLNETAFVESARALAQRVLTNRDGDSQRIAEAFRLATGRSPSPEELGLLRERVENLRADYAVHIDEAQELLSVGELPPLDNIDLPDQAAYTVICSLLLNLDETLCRH